jgi:hypothetical protein
LGQKKDLNHGPIGEGVNNRAGFRFHTGGGFPHFHAGDAFDFLPQERHIVGE